MGSRPDSTLPSARTCRAAVAVLAAVLAGSPLRADERLVFNRDVRPILADNCFACHGPDKAKRKAKLRLDVRDSALLGLGLIVTAAAVSPRLRAVGCPDGPGGAFSPR